MRTEIWSSLLGDKNLETLTWQVEKRPVSKRQCIQDTASPSSTSDASATPLFKRTRSVHSKSLTIQLDQILWTCTNASLRCHLSTTNRSSFASAVNESLHRLHCLHRLHGLHGSHFGKCELLRAGARSFGEAWAMKTKDV